MAWEPDRRSNFFFSPPAHLCAVTYMTEISLIVTLKNQFNPTQPNQPGFQEFFLMQNSWKPGICISYGYKQSYYTRTPCIQKVFIATYSIIRNSFMFKNGNRRYKYLVLGHEESYFVKEHSDSKHKYSEDDIINMLEFW